VTFTHLPERATIRVFNLAGTMVRVIDKDGPSQFQQWDLQNQNGIPVASGIYLVHIETLNGDKVLKVAVVQEEQILERY
jgi:flagellar hook assembly protein FlgD